MNSDGTSFGFRSRDNTWWKIVSPEKMRKYNFERNAIQHDFPTPKNNKKRFQVYVYCAGEKIEFQF